MSQPCSSLWIPQIKKKPYLWVGLHPKTNLRSHHAPPVIFRKTVRLWIVAVPSQGKLHSHVCISSLFGTWDQHLSRWFLWVCTRKRESAFSIAVPCLCWQMEWPLLLADLLRSLVLNCKYFLSLVSSKGLAALNVLCTMVFSGFKELWERHAGCFLGQHCGLVEL